MSYSNEVFAPLDRDHHLERIGGGFETEVYCTDDRRHVVKLKEELGGDLASALEHVRHMRTIAEEFARCLGPKHSLPNYYVLSKDSAGQVQALVVQPFIETARPLGKVHYEALSDDDRAAIAEQLHGIVRSSLAFYRETGYMPDLYGLSSSSLEERLGLRRFSMFPRQLWSFLAKRNILRSHNLLLAISPRPHVVLVDYDLVRWSPLVRRIYFAVRWLMCWRDHWLIARMARKPEAADNEVDDARAPAHSTSTVQQYAVIVS